VTVATTLRLGTTDRNATQRALEALYAARFAGDESVYLSFFSTRVRMNAIGNPALRRGGGERHGHRGLAAHLALIHTKARFSDHSIEDVIATENRLAVRWAVDVTDAETGRQARQSALDIMRIENGEIADVIQFVDVDPV
jgi:ketosteroid isomerase-like protein